jgi:hypothetical protein
VTLLVEDVEAAREGREDFRPPSLDDAASQLDTFGVVVLRDVFDPQQIAGLLERTRKHAAYVEAKATAGETDFEFDESYVFSPRNLACELTALDPLTAGRSDDFTETSLYAAMMTHFVREFLIDLLGPEAFWWVARVRVSIPGNEGKPHGRLSLHTESAQIPHLVGLHNIWTPLMPPGVVTNIDCPGLQFYVGRLSWLAEMSKPHRAEVEAFLGEFTEAMTEESPELDDDGFFFRPRLRTGDIAIFAGAIPHTAYVPPTAKTVRANFDVRLFQESDEPNARTLRFSPIRAGCA